MSGWLLKALPTHFSRCPHSGNDALLGKTTDNWTERAICNSAFNEKRNWIHSIISWEFHSRATHARWCRCRRRFVVKLDGNRVEHFAQHLTVIRQTVCEAISNNRALDNRLSRFDLPLLGARWRNENFRRSWPIRRWICIAMSKEIENSFKFG